MRVKEGVLQLRIHIRGVCICASKRMRVNRPFPRVCVLTPDSYRTEE